MLLNKSSNKLPDIEFIFFKIDHCLLSIFSNGDFIISFFSKHSSKLLLNKLIFKKHCLNGISIFPSIFALIKVKNNKRLSFISLSTKILLILL